VLDGKDNTFNETLTGEGEWWSCDFEGGRYYKVSEVRILNRDQDTAYMLSSTLI
jgi:hypothetical protein